MAGGISGTGVAVATMGGLLAYAGFRGVNPFQALREIASGSPQSITSAGAGFDTNLVGNWAKTTVGNAVAVTGSGAALVTALAKFSGDKYSQTKRWQNGFSDCSSFVGKGFKAIGITPPGSSTTWEYLAWKMTTKVSRAQVAPGDLVVNASHIVVVVDSTRAIGQENPSTNVRVDTIENLMYGTGSFTCLRYTGWGGAAVGTPLIAPTPNTNVLGVTH